MRNRLKTFNVLTMLQTTMIIIILATSPGIKVRDMESFVATKHLDLGPSGVLLESVRDVFLFFSGHLIGIDSTSLCKQTAQRSAQQTCHVLCSINLQPLFNAGSLCPVGWREQASLFKR